MAARAIWFLSSDGALLLTALTTTEFNRFTQESTPLLPKQVKRFIEAY
jgi:hypothetical protein